jgi:AcrR family transcriptional regulator
MSKVTVWLPTFSSHAENVRSQAAVLRCNGVIDQGICTFSEELPVSNYLVTISIMKPDPNLQKQKILDAAAVTFARDGFAGARVDRIAAAAGLNKRLLYHYVGAKAELLRAVLSREARQLADRSLADPLLWRLILEEAGHLEDSQLADALCEKAIHERGGAAGERLAMAMMQALLPDLLDHLRNESAADQTSTPGPESGRTKPRVRMQPKVSGSRS